MAFDGIVISNIVSELKQKLTGGRISKIAQPEPEELVLTIKNKKRHLPSVSISKCKSSADLSDAGGRA